MSWLSKKPLHLWVGAAGGKRDECRAVLPRWRFRGAIIFFYDACDVVG